MNMPEKPLSDVLNTRPYTPLETIHLMVTENQNLLARHEYELRFWQRKRISAKASVDESLRIATAKVNGTKEFLSFLLEMREEEVKRFTKLMEEEKPEPKADKS